MTRFEPTTTPSSWSRLRCRRRDGSQRACQAGVNVVLLEAGGHMTNEDYVNNEWEAFNQMAWLDPRTTTGSWRLARDFPNLPAWIVKAVGGTTTHWSGATPRFNAHEFKARTAYGESRAPTCWTGRSPWPTSSRTTTRPRTTSASPIATAARHCRRTTTTRCWPTARSGRLPLLRDRPVRHQRRTL